MHELADARGCTIRPGTVVEDDAMRSSLAREVVGALAFAIRRSAFRERCAGIAQLMDAHDARASNTA